MSNKNKLLDFDLDELIRESVKGLFTEVSAGESAENMKEKLRQEEKAASSAKRKKKMKEDPKENAGDEGTENARAEKPVQIKHEKVPEINLNSIVDRIAKFILQ